MKHCKYLFALCCAALIAASCPFTADARDDASRARMDSLAVRLAKRLEAGAWKFTATSFTGDNNIRADYLDAKSNTVTMLNDKILIRLDFFGARITAMGTTPHQRGRAIAETAAANIYVDTADLTTRIVFNKMNLDGTLEGKITLL